MAALVYTQTSLLRLHSSPTISLVTREYIAVLVSKLMHARPFERYGFYLASNTMYCLLLTDVRCIFSFIESLFGRRTLWYLFNL